MCSSHGASSFIIKKSKKKQKILFFPINATTAMAKGLIQKQG